MNTRATLCLVALLGLVTGVVIGARELVAVAIGLSLAAAASWAWQWSSHGLRIEITLSPSRLAAAETTVVRVRAVNEGARRSPPLWGVVEVRASDGRDVILVPVMLPSLGPGERHPGGDIPLTIPRRGRFDLGLVVADVLGLASWALVSPRVAELWVHPVVHRPVAPPVAGAGDDEGTIAAGGLSGGEAFQYLREYVPGDDVRLIHSRASAAHGLDRGVPWPVVRHQVVDDDPELVVVLDTAWPAYGRDGDDAFEEAVSAAASLVEAGSVGGVVRLAVGSDGRALLVTPEGGRTEALDRLAEVRTNSGAGAPLGWLGGGIPEGTAAVVVTGPLAVPVSTAIALRDQGVRSVVNVHLGGTQAPAGMGPDDHWFATSLAMANRWHPNGTASA